MSDEVRHALTILAVDDLPRCAAFYERVFGWTPTVQVPVYVELAIPGGQRLGLYRHDGYERNLGRAAARTPAGSLTATELYLYASDVPAAIERLRAAGAPEISPLGPRDWGDDVAYFADPSGNVLAIAQRSPR
jgi:catechol 2,3-dioxygenase-like lactoylglutathione lyase family enzyme